MRSIAIIRRENTSAKLRQIARYCKNSLQASRLFAIADILDGKSRIEASQSNGMSIKSLCFWVKRYNKEGIEGLRDRLRSGRRKVLTVEQESEFKAIIEAGPSEEDNIVRWRCVDLQQWLQKHHNITVHERTVGKWLKKLGFSHMIPRPIHRKNDPEVIEKFKKNL